MQNDTYAVGVQGLGVWKKMIANISSTPNINYISLELRVGVSMEYKLVLSSYIINGILAEVNSFSLVKPTKTPIYIFLYFWNL